MRMTRSRKRRAFCLANGTQSARDYELAGGHLISSRILIVLAADTGLFVDAPNAPLAAEAENAQLAQLWQEPNDLSSRDLFLGPWGAQNAPDAAATYTFVRPKSGGVNPGVVVRDPQGRTWHVKQSPLDDDKP